MRESTPRILVGTHAFTGTGYDTPAPLGVTYTVPSDRRAQTVYFRAGNSTGEMISVVLVRDGTPMRSFPLVVVEDLQPETKLEMHVLAPAGCSGTLVLDMGFVEI